MLAIERSDCITLPRVNNFDIKQKMTWNVCFIIYPKHQTKSEWMLTRHKIFHWQHNYLFFLEELFWIFDINCHHQFFVKSLNHHSLLINQQNSNFVTSTEFELCYMKLTNLKVESWNLFQINDIAIIDVTGVK